MAEAPKLFKVTIDNITIEVAPGTSILNAARKIGGDVTPPAMCYYSKLQGSGGKCRTCLVEVAAGSTADPRPMPKLVASCRTNVMDGMVVKNITSERVIDAREWCGGIFIDQSSAWIALSATRPVNVICRISVMIMAKKEHVMNLQEEHLRKKISVLIYNCT